MRPLPLPPVIGHRGAAAYAPENTLAGFSAAAALGCRWVEFDVRLTADGEPVICHDDRLERTTDGHGRISKMMLAAICNCDAGSWFGESFAGERLPRLDAALACCRELGLGANVEIKAERGRGPDTAAATAACLRRLAGRLPSLLVSSFLLNALAEMSLRAPEVPRGVLFRKIPRGWAKIAVELGCVTIHADHNSLSEGLVARVRGAGYPLLAYTVNDDARARQLFGWGVASVFSDSPNIISTAATAEDLTAARRGAFL
jgi:glycerophosphoryl diester phosphodiesterase